MISSESHPGGPTKDLLSSPAHAALLVLYRAQAALCTVPVVTEEATSLWVSHKPTDTRISDTRISPTKLLVPGKQTVITVT